MLIVYKIMLTCPGLIETFLGSSDREVSSAKVPIILVPSIKMNPSNLVCRSNNFLDKATSTLLIELRSHHLRPGFHFHSNWNSCNIPPKFSHLRSQIFYIRYIRSRKGALELHPKRGKSLTPGICDEV